MSAGAGGVIDDVLRMMLLAAMPRRRDLIGYWSKHYPDFQLSSLEFYASLAEILRNQQVPELLILRKRWKESGLISSRREYLRISYGRYSCDVCAAPFGINYFFSCWTGLLPRKLTWRNQVGMATSFIVAFALLLAKAGLGALVVLLMSIGIFAMLRRRGLFQSQGQFDEFLSGITVIGPILDIFRPLTYFEVDTAHAFHEMVQRCLLSMIDKVTEVHGLQPLTEKERAPVMRELMMK